MGSALSQSADRYTRQQVLDEVANLRRQLDAHRTEVRRLTKELNELRAKQKHEIASRSMNFAALLGWWEQNELPAAVVASARRLEELALACSEEEEQEVLVEDLLEFLLEQVDEDEEASEEEAPAVFPPETEPPGQPGSSSPESLDRVLVEQHMALGFNEMMPSQGAQCELYAQERQLVQVNAPVGHELQRATWASVNDPHMVKDTTASGEGGEFLPFPFPFAQPAVAGLEM